MRWILWIITASTVSCVALAAGCLEGAGSQSNLTENQINTMFRKELPLGTTREAVIAFLDQNKIEHHAAPSPGIPSDVVYARFRKVAGGNAIVEKSILATFHFKEGKLTGYSLDVELTGP